MSEELVASAAARGERHGETTLTTAAAVLLFVAVWLLYGMISRPGMVLHDDLTEAYVWGREFRLGYNQHPPFWAWIAGAWFRVFPTRDWAFLLLAVVNSAVGLLGAWRLIGRFVGGPARQAALLLLLCTPFYTFGCLKYNANSIFLSIWPWTLYFLLRALESRRLWDGVWLGLMFGVAMLSKYYAVILIATCFAGLLLHADSRRYWRSATPWTSIAVALALVSPHVMWLIDNHAPPIKYALSTGNLGLQDRVVRSVSVVFAAAAVQAAIPVLIWFTRRRGPAIVHGHIRMLTVLVALPSALTVAFGLAFGLRLSAEMLIGTFPLAPVLAMTVIPGADPRRLLRWAMRAVAAVTVISLASVPITNRLLHRPTDPSWQLPIRETVQAALALWHDTTGRPLVTVGGSKYFSNAAAFYSDDHPSGFLMLEFGLAPWVTPKTLRNGGLLAICDRQVGPLDDVWCRGNAERLATPNTTVTQMTLTHRVGGHDRGTSTVDVYITPPAP